MCVCFLHARVCVEEKHVCREMLKRKGKKKKEGERWKRKKKEGERGRKEKEGKERGDKESSHGLLSSLGI